MQWNMSPNFDTPMALVYDLAEDSQPHTTAEYVDQTMKDAEEAKRALTTGTNSLV